MAALAGAGAACVVEEGRMKEREGEREREEMIFFRRHVARQLFPRARPPLPLL